MKKPTILLFATLLALTHTEGLRGDGSVYYAESGFGDTISRWNFTTDITTGSNQILRAAPSSPRAVAIDHVNSKIYYSFGKTIEVANLDGSGQSVVVADVGGDGGNSIDDLEVDPTAAKLYFSRDSGTLAQRGIFSVNTDGTMQTAIHTNASLAAFPTITATDVRNISVDTTTGTLYWTSDNGSNNGTIGFNSSTIAGTSVVQNWVGTGREDSISKMDIDFTNGLMYYTVGSSTDEVRRSTLTNGGLTTVASGIGNNPYAIALDLTNDDLFFVVAGTLFQSELDGSSQKMTTLGTSTLFSVQDIEFGATVVPEPSSACLLFGFLGGICLIGRRH